MSRLKIEGVHKVVMDKANMPDIVCGMCDGNPRDGGIGQMVQNQDSKFAICYDCAKAATLVMEKSQELMKDAVEEAVTAFAADIETNENGECMCPKCIAQRKIDAIRGGMPSGVTRH